MIVHEERRASNRPDVGKERIDVIVGHGENVGGGERDDHEHAEKDRKVASADATATAHSGERHRALVRSTEPQLKSSTLEPVDASGEKGSLISATCNSPVQKVRE